MFRGYTGRVHSTHTHACTHTHTHAPELTVKLARQHDLFLKTPEAFYVIVVWLLVAMVTICVSRIASTLVTIVTSWTITVPSTTTSVAIAASNRSTIIPATVSTTTPVPVTSEITVTTRVSSGLWLLINLLLQCSHCQIRWEVMPLGPWSSWFEPSYLFPQAASLISDISPSQNLPRSISSGVFFFLGVEGLNNGEAIMRGTKFRGGVGSGGRSLPFLSGRKNGNQIIPRCLLKHYKIWYTFLWRKAHGMRLGDWFSVYGDCY